MNEIEESNLHETPLLDTEDVMEMLGVTRQTLFNWTKAGKIKKIQITPKRCKYDENSIYEFIGRSTPRKLGTVIYARVDITSDSLKKNRESLLAKQVIRMENWCEKNGLKVGNVYEDISSAIEWNKIKRPGINTLLRDVVKRKIKQVIVDSPDKIGMFSYKSLRELFSVYGTRLVFVNMFPKDKESIRGINKELTESIQMIKDMSTGVV